MNLVYRYLLSKTKETYRRGADYLLLKNYDTEPAYLLNSVRIEPGEYFVLEQSKAYEVLNFILYEKKVVIIQSIHSGDGPTGKGGTNEDYRTTAI